MNVTNYLNLLNFWLMVLDMTWTTQDGSEIPVSKMDDEHVRNTVSMIRRNVPDRLILNLYLRGLYEIEREVDEEEFRINGDLAQEHIDRNMFPEPDEEDMEYYALEQEHKERLASEHSNYENIN